MANWASICQMMKYADKQSEMAYQKYVRDMILDIALGWKKEEITEQLSLQLGSTQRLIPDILVSKDPRNRFIIEMKRPGHTKTRENIDQLVSYMKQMEVPVGIYISDELDVYYKTIGDGSMPVLIMSLHFNIDDKDGDTFVSLFSSDNFSIDKIREFKEFIDKKTAYKTKVDRLLNEVTSIEFKTELRSLISKYLIGRGEDKDVIEDVLDNTNITLSTIDASTSSIEYLPTQKTHNHQLHQNLPRRKVTVQRYAYNLIEQIIKKNRHLRFGALYSIFGKKNRISDIKDIADPKRWFTDEEDIITIADGTRIVISNQWGFNNNCKAKMDELRKIAESFGIDATLPE
ncbi:MAG: type I restriction enzyme HsdR N-terminal domain-containing protein [Duncaniella sp.]|nr:type I restriction enzyme HsdR N-terminal domain-containing protein [Duncaniella sp.]